MGFAVGWQILEKRREEVTGLVAERQKAEASAKIMEPVARRKLVKEATAVRLFAQCGSGLFRG
jgi:hypothetical protein